MTTNVNDAYLKQVANGSTNIFTYDFYIAQQSDLLVFLNGVEESVVDITGVGENSGGTFTVAAIPESMTVVLAIRELPIERKTNFITNGDLTAALLNKEFDYINNLIEQSEVRNTRSIKFSDEVDLTAATMALGQPLPDSMLRVDATGNLISFVIDAENPLIILMQDQVGNAEGFANASEASSVTSSGFADNSETSKNQSSGFANDSSNFATTSSGFADDSEAFKGESETARNKAREWAINDEDVAVEAGEFSAKHWAIKAEQTANAAFVSGGLHDPTVSPYPNVGGVVVDTIWIFEKPFTYVSGDLNGVTVNAGDQLFFDTPGNLFTAIAILDSGVLSINGNTDSIQTLDFSDVGAVADTITVNGQALTSNVSITNATLGAVPTTTTVNGQALSSNVSITLGTLGYTGATNANNYVHSLNATSNVNTLGAEVIDQISTDSEGHITVLSKRVMTAANLNAVPESRTVNGKTLGSNITLGADDVVALGYATGGNLTSGTAAPSGGSNGDVYIQYT